MLEVDLRPTLAAVISIPLVEDFSTSYRQQFRSFDGLWLPVDYRLTFAIEIGMIGLQFPLIGMDQVTRFADYEVVSEPAGQTEIDSLALHAILPDSVFAAEQTMRVDSAAVRRIWPFRALPIR